MEQKPEAVSPTDQAETFFFEQIRWGEIPTYYFIDRKSSETEPLQWHL